MYRNGILCGLLAVVAVLLASNAYAHRGNPWHGPSATGSINGVGLGTVGFGTIWLRPGGEGRFRLEYYSKVQGLVSSATKLAAGVVPDSALADGVVTPDELTAFSTGGEGEVEFEFIAKEEGLYHIFFGPWDGVLLFVGEDPPVKVEPVSGGDANWIARVAGDVSIATTISSAASEKPDLRLWVVEVFPDAAQQIHVQTMGLTGSDANLLKPASNKIYDELRSLGLPF